VQSGAILPGQPLRTILTVTTPRNATSGDFALRPHAAWAGGAGLPWSLRTVALAANATVEPQVVDVRVQNTGTGDAVDLDVSLYQDGNRVDEFIVPRIPAGGVAKATLALPSSRSGAFEVRVDEAGRFGDAIVQPVDARGNDVPGAPLLLALAGAAAVAAARRRR
jgi:hypothetical protein